MSRTKLPAAKPDSHAEEAIANIARALYFLFSSGEIPNPPDTKLAYRPGEASKKAGIPRSTTYFLMNTGEIPSFKVGKTRLILHDDLKGVLRERAKQAKRNGKR